MSRMIVFLVVVIVLFGAAAGGSWYLQMQQTKDDGTHSVEEKPKAAAPVKSTSESPIKLPPLRATPGSDAERLSQLANSLQQQKEFLESREKEIGVREKQMDIVHAQVKKEQKRLDGVRKEIQVELQRVEDKLEQIERRTAEGSAERRAIDIQRKDLERMVVTADAQEWTNIKTQMKTFEKLNPETTAGMVVEMASQGKMDTTAKILAQMRAPQAAAILDEVSKIDSKLASQLVERVILVRAPSVAAPK